MVNALTRGLGLLALVYGLSGCAGMPRPSLDQIKPICAALIGPIKYNSTNKVSVRYAGHTLALDLKQRNQVGQYLHCPAYR